MTQNHLELLKVEFEDDKYPITLKQGKKGLKMVIPCRFSPKGKRNFLDLWNGKTAGICYSVKVWRYLKSINSGLYPWLEKGHNSSSGTLHHEFYDYDKVRSLLRFLKSDYLSSLNKNSTPILSRQVVKQNTDSPTDERIYSPDSTNYIYLVAGERMMKPDTAKGFGGLWANVGMTKNGRLPEDRIKDKDYKAKQTGGELIVVKKWEVGNYLDHTIHRILKNRNDIFFEQRSKNTEEFLFKGDDGSGRRAIQIIEDILQNTLDLPEFILEKIEKLRLENKVLRGTY